MPSRKARRCRTIMVVTIKLTRMILRLRWNRNVYPILCSRLMFRLAALKMARQESQRRKSASLISRPVGQECQFSETHLTKSRSYIHPLRSAETSSSPLGEQVFGNPRTVTELNFALTTRTKYNADKLKQGSLLSVFRQKHRTTEASGIRSVHGELLRSIFPEPAGPYDERSAAMSATCLLETL